MKKGVPSVLKQMHKKGSCAKAGSEYKANKRMDSLSTSTRIPSVCVVVVVVGWWEEKWNNCIPGSPKC